MDLHAKSILEEFVPVYTVVVLFPILEFFNPLWAFSDITLDIYRMIYSTMISLINVDASFLFMTFQSSDR